MLKIFVLSTLLSITTLGWAAPSSEKILLVSAEQDGIFKTGGLAIAVNGLAQALAKYMSVDVMMPLYTHLDQRNLNIKATNTKFTIGLDVENNYAHRRETFSLHSLNSENARTLFLKHDPHPGQTDYFDNPLINDKKNYGPANMTGEAFGAWAKATAEYILTQNYDTIILNDWHSGLVAVFLDMAKQEGRKTPKVITAIHNLAFQGEQWRHMLFTLGIPEKYFNADWGIEFYSKVNYLKGALQFSDHVYTVSPNYAQEIATSRFGSGLEGLIARLTAEQKMSGVLNGIINAEWDPTHISDERKHDLKWEFSEKDFSGKAKGKHSLQVEMGFVQDPHIPIFVLTSRVAEQKGFEYLIDALDQFLAQKNAQILIIGDGEDLYLKGLKALERKYSDQVRFNKFSESLERKLITYGDFFINAAWFEPSGLNQFFALKNGTIPILSNIGGLANSVKDGKTGFLNQIIWNKNQDGYHKEKTAKSLYKGLLKAATIFENQPEKIKKMRIAGMKQDNSWNSRVQKDFLSLLKKTHGEPLRKGTLMMSCEQIF